MKNWEEKIRKELGKKTVVIQQAGMDGYGLWSGNMEMERKGECGTPSRKISKIDIGNG